MIKVQHIIYVSLLLYPTTPLSSQQLSFVSNLAISVKYDINIAAF